MTLLHTSSYRAFQPTMGQPVAISLGLPKWRAEAAQWPRCWLLTPTSSMFHGPAEEFAGAYTARLARFGPARIARELEHVARDHHAESLILLCHEPEWTNCHRHRFASWWMQTTGELVTELEGGPPVPVADTLPFPT